MDSLDTLGQCVVEKKNCILAGNKDTYATVQRTICQTLCNPNSQNYQTGFNQLLVEGCNFVVIFALGYAQIDVAKSEPYRQNGLRAQTKVLQCWYVD